VYISGQVGPTLGWKVVPADALDCAFQRQQTAGAIELVGFA
jgi:hypothetical protein